jgi:anti-sigma-K factor RskA
VNIHDYISSGILESYALGELPEQERREVERLVAKHPELREELTRIEDAQEKMLMNAAISPRAYLKIEILERISDKKEVKTIALRPWQFAAAASLTLALIASYFAIDYRTRWKESESSLATLLSQNRQMAENYNQVNNRIDKMEEAIGIMENPQFQRVLMTATTNAPSNALASVFWNADSNELYLKIHNLKQLASDQQYQLWAIIDGKPVDAGVFDVDQSGMLRMKQISKGAVTFAVTVEPRGGKQTPTFETMQVAGNVQKS